MFKNVPFDDVLFFNKKTRVYFKGTKNEVISQLASEKRLLRGQEAHP